MSIELKVYPNTGHQYFTFSLEKLCPSKDPASLVKLAQAHLEEPWQVWDPYPWVRYQYAFTKEITSRAASITGLTPIIKIAVETNMSIPSNGLLCEVQSGLEQKGDESFLFPYASDDASRIVDNLGPGRSVPLISLPGTEIAIDLFVVFLVPAGDDPIEVDLVVDLGNTRTAAVLLETRARGNAADWPLARRLKVLQVIPPGIQYDAEDKESDISLDNDCEIIPSWLLMHRPTFASLEPSLNYSQLYDIYQPYPDPKIPGKTLYRRERYLPRSFIELSPAMIGGGKSEMGAARRLSDLVITSGLYYLSSPKRYVWDDAPKGEGGDVIWMQVKNNTDPNQKSDPLAQLGGMIRIYMDPDAHDWDIDNPPNDKNFLRRYEGRSPKYPRRDAVCWFALSLIEAAHRQINSRSYLKSTSYKDLPRRLRHIMVTYPAGWNQEIKQNYFNQWQRAINLFTLTHFDADKHASVLNGGCRPNLVDENVNEAICSQLPILYSDLRTLFNKPEEWFQLYGDGDNSVIVMNLDIGGGTTDLTVIRYKAGKQGSLEPHLLFQDGRSTAGDELVKKIIEKLLIPAWLNAADQSQYKNLPDAKEWLCNLFNDPSNATFAHVDPDARYRLARITRLLFIPLVNKLLTGMVGLEGKPEKGLDPLDLSEEVGLVEGMTLELNKMASRIIREKCRNGQQWKGTAFPLKGTRLNIPAAGINECIDAVFGDFCKSLGRVAGHFRCQLVVVTGKPSELPRLRELIAEVFPVLPQRIIHARNFPAGRWYPFGSFGVGAGETGRIMDAKSCTVVGAALYLDSRKNPHLMKFLTIENSASEQTGRYYWGVVPTQGQHSDFYDKKNLLFSPPDYKKLGTGKDRLEIIGPEIELTINDCRIGRQIIKVENIRPEPVYELCFSPERGTRTIITRSVRAKCKFKWIWEKGKGEWLELVKAEPIENTPDLENAVAKLRLNTLYENSFWLDDPSFQVALE